MKKKNKLKKLNNAGLTMTEMIVTFALLSLFMVAATRIMSYTMMIYYAARGNTYGLEVSTMISNKIVGQLENASAATHPVVSTDDEGNHRISFIDATGSSVWIGTKKIVKNGVSMGPYMTVHYDEVTEGSVPYEATDWTFDPNTYMGYVVRGLTFEQPGIDYPDNVVRMTLELESDRYGSYKTVSYIKCVNVEKIEY